MLISSNTGSVLPVGRDSYDLFLRNLRFQKRSNALVNEVQPMLEEKVEAKIGFFERFLHDNYWLRYVMALGNEGAESFGQTVEDLFGKTIGKIFYYTGWTAAFAATGIRVGVNAQKAKSEDKLKAGAKMAIHDGISTIVATTAVIRTMKYILNKIFNTIKLPTKLTNAISGTLALIVGKVTIEKFDPIARDQSAKWTGIGQNDHYKTINDALGAAQHKPST